MTKARELSELGSYLNVSSGVASVNNITVSSNLEINVVVANGSVGTAGQMLTSNGSGVYWLSPQIGDITNVIAGTGLTGGGSSGEVTVSLATSGVVANTYGNSSSIPVITVDTYGRLTNVSTTAVAGVTNFTYTGANNTFSISTGDGSTFTANITAANATQAGVITVIDSVTNTSVLIAASVNSVKTAYDTAISANTRAASAQTAAISAYSNAVSYTDSAILAANVSGAAATAYSNAVSVASTDATNKAANAYSNAVSYAATIAGTAYSNAVSAAASDATSKANNAYTTAVSAAATDATNKAANAYSNAVSYAATIAGTAYSNAISVAATDATNKAANAYSNAVSYAGTIAGTAYSNAVSTAASDATTKANNAYTTAISAASTDATNKAANAYSNAVTYASNASNISSGTLAEARLPFRMNQNVRTTDTVEFGNMTVTGNLTVTGTTVTVSANNLVLEDNMIYLNDGNTVANPDLGIAGNYNDGTYRHAGFFRDATDGVWKVYDQYLPEPDASPYIDTSNASFRIADFQANAVTMGSATVSGNVGIGTSSPGAKLHVQGTSYFNSDMFTYANGGIFFSGNNSYNVGLYSRSADLVFQANGSERMRITSAGDVGIGTSAPAGYGKLAVIGNIASSADGATVLTMRANAGATNLGSYNATGSYLAFQTNASGSGEVERMRITSAGDVGIGTSSPDGILHARGNIIRFDKTGTAEPTIRFRSANDSYTSEWGVGHRSSSNDFAIRWFSGSTWSEVFGITTAGNVGIGTASPSQKLHVAGTGLATADFRAPIFYDSDNTNYYLDPTSTSTIVKLRVDSAGNQPGGNIKIGPAGENVAKWSYLTGAHYSDTSESEGVSMIGLYASPSENQIVIGGAIYEANPATSINFYTHNAVTHSTGGTNRLNISSSGSVTAYVDLRAPVFYDSADSGYFFDLKDQFNNTYTKSLGGFYVDANGHYFRSTASALWAEINSDYLYHYSDIRSGLFYDYDNTFYYLDPASTSYLRNTYVDRYFQRATGTPTNNLGDPTVTEMALFDQQFTNKTEFFPPANVIFETSTDGTTWTTFSVSDAQKKIFVGGDDYSSISIPYNTPYFRVRFVNDGNYVFLNALYTYWASQGHTTKVQIYTKDFGSSTWVQYTNSNEQVSSWPGHLYLPFQTIAYHPGTYVDQVAVVFQPTWNPTWSANGIALYKMQIWGGYPAGKRTIYAVNADREVTFPAAVKAPIFYDSNDTTYYVDPASTGTALSTNGILVAGTGTSGGVRNRTYVAGRNRIWSFDNADNYGLSYFQGGPDYIGFHFGTATQVGSQFWVSDSGIGQASGSLRAPLFYDTDNTAYFLDAASGSTSLFTAGLLRTYGWVQAGYLTGGVAMTTNDGYGNANITWNHIGGTPEQNGNSARITVNTDATSGVYMDFQVKSNVTSGVAVGLTSALTAYETYTEIKNSTRSPIYYDSNNTAYWVDPASNSVLTSFNLGGGETYVYSGATNALNVRTGAGGSYKYFGFEAGGRFVVSNGGIFSGGYLDIQYNSGNEYAGMGIRNNYGSASLQATGFIDFINENGFQKASLFGVIATDGHGYLQFLSTAPGVSRSADSRTTTAYAYHNQWSFQTSAGIATNILYDRDNSTYYLDPSSSTVIENLAIRGSVYSVFDSAQYYDAALEIRERNLGGAQADSFNNAPRLGFHWGGRVAMQLALDSGSVLNVMNGDCTGWTAFRAGDMYGNAFYDRGDTGYYVDPTSTSVLNNLNVLNDIYITRTTNEYGFIVRPNSAGYKKLQFAVVGGGALEEVVANTTTLRSTGDVRGSIFYDTNNTAYYADPTGTSVFNALTVAGSPVMRGKGYAGSNNVDWNTLGNDHNAIYQANQETFNVGGTGNSNFPASASYKYGTIINFSANAEARAQMYISHNGNDLIFRGGWSENSWQTWNKVLTDQNYTSYSPSLTGSGASGTWGISITGNAATASNLTSTRANWGSTSVLSAVVGQLAWRNYGSNHTIFDASAGLTPDGTAVNNTNSQIGWAGTYPTLMGWNGSETYGVRVDSARLADGPSGSTFTASGDFRAPIFYDSNDTTYRIDGNGTSVLAALRVNYSAAGYVLQDYGWLVAQDSSARGISIGYDPSADRTWMYSRHVGVAGKPISLNDILIVGAGGGFTTSAGSMRTPIFYDSDNTGYYLDPSATGISLDIKGDIRSKRLDSGSGASWDTEIFIGETSNSEVNGTFPTSITGYGLSVRKNSDGAFLGLVTRDGGTNFDTVLGWGDDSDDTLFFRFNNVNKAYLNSSAVLYAAGDVRAPIFYNSNDTLQRWDGNSLILRGSSPTVYFRDTNENSAMIHVNSNLFYILRGGNDTETWTTAVNSAWPLQINLTNNDAQFGANLTALNGMFAQTYYDRDNTGYYINPASSSVIFNTEMINLRCKFDRSWDNYPGIIVYNTTDQGPQADFRIHGGPGANGGDFGVRLLVDGEITSLSNVNAGSAMYAPIYYDSNNTGYYFNGDGGSVLYNAYIINKFYARGGTGVDECCGSDATISVGGTSARPPSISFHYSGVMQGNMQANQTGWRKVYFYDDQGSGLGVHATGQIASNADIIAYYSDKRLKRDLARVVDHWNVINNLTGYRFTWNEKSGEIPGFQDKVGKREVGLIAQDVQAVYPEAIAMRTEGPEDDPYMTIKHDRFTAVFIEALKDLRRELDEVKEENKKLREMINGQ